METQSVSEPRGIVLMLVSIVLFSANVLLLRAIALGAPEVDGWVTSVFRGWVGLLIAVVVYRGRGFQPGHLLTRPLVVLRGAVGAAGVLLFYLTIAHLGAGRAVVINLSYPIFGAAMAAVWLKERLARQQWLWMVAGLAGLAVFFSGDRTTETGSAVYEVLGVLGAVAAGGAVVLIRLLSHREHASTIYASQCVWSFAAALPLGGHALWTLTPGLWMALVAASIVVAGGQLALTHSFRHLSVAKGSSVQMLLPLVTAAGAWMLFGERYTLPEVSGAILTLLATWQVLRFHGSRSLRGPATPSAAISSKDLRKQAPAVLGSLEPSSSLRAASSSSRNEPAPDQTV